VNEEGEFPMTTTDDKTGDSPAGGDEPPAGPSGAARAVRRYGPIAAVVVLVVGAIVLFGGGGDDDGDDSGSGDTAEIASGDDLIRSGPMTPQRAELEGVDDVDFGPTCDPETGRLALPLRTAPPCVEPFTGDNGGATSPGVTIRWARR
jgi:hypothetical protein